MANLQVEFKGNGITKIWSKQYVFDCFIVPRNSVASTIPEFENNMAVYFLVDSREGKIEKRHLYIGKTSTGMTRFFNHKSQKSWWNKIFIFSAHNRYFTEETILGLENLFITKYKESNLYIMEQEGSNKKIDEDCEFYAEQIMNIVDFLEYGCSIEEDEDEDTDNNEPIKNKVIDTKSESSNELFSIFDEKIKSMYKYISTDQMKRYIAYRFAGKNVCALWIRKYDIELELYINIKNIFEKVDGLYDIINRKRGLRETGFKIQTEKDIDQALLIIKQIIEKI